MSLLIMTDISESGMKRFSKEKYVHFIVYVYVIVTYSFKSIFLKSCTYR